MTINLTELAKLPLDMIAVSATCTADGELGLVDGVAEKLTASKEAGILHTYICQNITGEQAQHISVGQQLEAFCKSLVGINNQVYGSFVGLPPVLQDGNIYSDTDYHPLTELIKRLQHTFSEHDSGYILIQGGPYSGKTAFARSWQRQRASVNHAHNKLSPNIHASSTYPELKQISGYFFARRYAGVFSNKSTQHSQASLQNHQDSEHSVENDSDTAYINYELDSNYVNEAVALQSLIALARRHHDLTVPSTEAELYTGRYDADATQEKKLFDNFKDALTKLATKATASKPLVLLLDGADELWGMGEQAKNVRDRFPDLMPQTLPKHTYLVVLSRPGSHLVAPLDKMQPIQRIELNTKNLLPDVTSYFQRVLYPEAYQIETGLPQLTHANEFRIEEKDILEQPSFQKNIIDASEGAFGYIPYLIKHLLSISDPNTRLNKLKNWQQQPQSLPKGIYGIRARELMGLYTQISKDSQLGKDFVQALASISILKQSFSMQALASLFYYDITDEDKQKKLFHALKYAQSICFQGNQDNTLTFSHKSMGELTQALYVLYCDNAIGHDSMEVDSQKLANTARDMANTDFAEHTYTVLLHQRISKGFSQVLNAIEKHSPKPVPVAIKADKRYQSVWGLYHALLAQKALLEKNPNDERVINRLNKLLDLLHNAGFFQTLIRTDSENFTTIIQHTFALAGRLIKQQSDIKYLHWKIESLLLQWKDSLYKSNELTVGGLFWNMLGAWEYGLAYAQQWKDSIDTKAIISKKAGQPPDYDWVLEGYSEQILSKCGKWLVTSGNKGTALWSVEKSTTYQVKDNSLYLKDLKIDVDKKHNIIYLLGKPISKELCVVVACIDIGSKTFSHKRLYGHLDNIITTNFYIIKETTTSKIFLRTFSDDNSIGLLVIGAQSIQRSISSKQYLHRFSFGIKKKITDIAVTRLTNDEPVVAILFGDTRQVGVMYRSLRFLEKPSSSYLSCISPHLYQEHTKYYGTGSIHLKAINDHEFLLVLYSIKTIGLKVISLYDLLEVQSGLIGYLSHQYYMSKLSLKASQLVSCDILLKDNYFIFANYYHVKFSKRSLLSLIKVSLNKIKNQVPNNKIIESGSFIEINQQCNELKLNYLNEILIIFLLSKSNIYIVTHPIKKIKEKSRFFLPINAKVTRKISTISQALHTLDAKWLIEEYMIVLLTQDNEHHYFITITADDILKTETHKYRYSLLSYLKLKNFIWFFENYKIFFLLLFLIAPFLYLTFFIFNFKKQILNFEWVRHRVKSKKSKVVEHHFDNDVISAVEKSYETNITYEEAFVDDKNTITLISKSESSVTISKFNAENFDSEEVFHQKELANTNTLKLEKEYSAIMFDEHSGAIFLKHLDALSYIASPHEKLIAPYGVLDFEVKDAKVIDNNTILATGIRENSFQLKLFEIINPESSV